ncbi:thioredoxin family protein [Porticoccaceae bacterium LTM1]|nr:thioredoxin family protein [Porticoccaceae bacterium LTM1]
MKVRFVAVLFSMLFLGVSLNVSAEGIEFFYGSWDELKEKASKEGKDIFVDVYTQWCGPCKLVAKTVFPKKEVGDFYNKHFVNYKLDAEDEDQNGPELAEIYNISSYPTYLFLKPDGEVIYRSGSGADVATFLKIGEKAVSGGDQYEQLNAEYHEGNRDPGFLRRYLLEAKIAERAIPRNERKSYYDFHQNVFSEYFSLADEKELLSEGGYRALALYSKSRGSKGVEYLIENYDQYSEIVGSDVISENLAMINSLSISNTAMRGDEKYRDYVLDIKGKLFGAYKEVEGKASTNPFLSPLYAKFIGDQQFTFHKRDFHGYLNAFEEYERLGGSQADKSRVVSDLVILAGSNRDNLNEVKPYAYSLYKDVGSLGSKFSYGLIMARMGESAEAKSILEEVLMLCSDPEVTKGMYRGEVESIKRQSKSALELID